MEFNMREMRFECSCGHPRAHVKVNITSDSNMAFSWDCLKCGKKVLSLVSFEKLITDATAIPSPLCLPAPLLNAQDFDELKGLKISWGD